MTHSGFLCDCVTVNSGYRWGAFGWVPSFCGRAAVNNRMHTFASLCCCFRTARAPRSRAPRSRARSCRPCARVGHRFGSHQQGQSPHASRRLHTWHFPPFWLFRWMLIGLLTTWCVTVTGASRLGLFTGGRRSWETSGHFLEGHAAAALCSPALVCCVHTCWDGSLAAVLDLAVIAAPGLGV